MKIQFALLSTAFLALVACESLSIYKPAKSVGDTGFSEQKLTDDQYRVTFQGNANTSRSRVEDYLLFRAAELTLENDFNYFVVNEHNTDVDKDYLIRYTNSYGLYDHYHGPIEFRFPYYAYGYKWGYPMQGSVREINRYSAIAYIKMYSGAPETDADTLVFNAENVMENFGPVDCWHEEPHDEEECKLAHPK